MFFLSGIEPLGWIRLEILEYNLDTPHLSFSRSRSYNRRLGMSHSVNSIWDHVGVICAKPASPEVWIHVRWLRKPTWGSAGYRDHPPSWLTIFLGPGACIISNRVWAVWTVWVPLFYRDVVVSKRRRVWAGSELPTIGLYSLF